MSASASAACWLQPKPPKQLSFMVELSQPVHGNIWPE